MRIELIARNYRIPDRLKEIIDKKMEKFSRYFDDDATAKITLRQVGKDGKEKYIMEITIYFDGNMVRSEVSSDNMFNNIDVALPKIEGQIRKHRTKLGKMKKAAYDQASLYEIDETPKKELVRTKTFSLKKITVKDAIEEMELVDHDFFAFVNDDNGMVNIVYRRSDGNVGLIDLVY